MLRHPPPAAVPGNHTITTEHATRRWTRKRGASSVRPDVSTLRSLTYSAPGNACATRRFEELWDRHGGSVYTLACALLGDEPAAADAMSLGMSDLARSPSAVAADDHRSWAHHVYQRCQELHDETPRTSPSPPLTSLDQLDQPQRTCLALCLYGAHTSRQVASLLGVPLMTVADLLTTGLRDVQRLTAGGPPAVA